MYQSTVSLRRESEIVLMSSAVVYSTLQRSSERLEPEYLLFLQLSIGSACARTIITITNTLKSIFMYQGALKQHKVDEK
jgi:hypothetical protein